MGQRPVHPLKINLKKHLQTNMMKHLQRRKGNRIPESELKYRHRG